jgi:GNAT superfamily N-acetyltransferase
MFKVQGCEPISTLNFEPGTLNSGSPVAFCAVLATLGWKRTKHISRLVVLPEFQGLGVGPRLAEAAAEREVAKGHRVTITASHPAIVACCWRSPRWRFTGLKKTGSTRQRLGARNIRASTGRAVASFEFVPP